MSELVIDEKNFEQYFHDVRKHDPKKGQVMACYRAVAEFSDGILKRNMIDLIRHEKNKAEVSVKVMQKLGCATYLDAIRIPLEMVRDLQSGMSVEEVARKVYKYKLEMFFWAEKENVPIDPHWSIVGMLNLDDFCDKHGNKASIRTKTVDAAGNEIKP